MTAFEFPGHFDPTRKKGGNFYRERKVTLTFLAYVVSLDSRVNAKKLLEALKIKQLFFTVEICFKRSSRDRFGGVFFLSFK